MLVCWLNKRLVRLDDELFEPYSHENEHQSLLAATAYIGGAERCVAASRSLVSSLSALVRLES